MRNYLLGGIAIAGALIFMIPAAPAFAQGGCGIDRPCVGGRVAGPGPSRFAIPHHTYARDYGRRDRFGVGAGVAAGLATGLIVGGALQQSQDYDTVDSYPVYPDQDPGYVDASPQVAYGDDAVAYCQQTYRSYDPASGTYLGYDGLRHPCP